MRTFRRIQLAHPRVFLLFLLVSIVQTAHAGAQSKADDNELVRFGTVTPLGPRAALGSPIIAGHIAGPSQMLVGSENRLKGHWKLDQRAGQALNEYSPSAQTRTVGTTSAEPGSDLTSIVSMAALNLRHGATSGDFDGDGKTDIAVYRPANGVWYIVYSSTGTAAGFQWGTAGDLPVPGDYDGDGKTDIAVYRLANGVWYIVYSSTGVAAGVQWGTAGDLPVPGDYDGDAKTDIAVYRPANGVWYIVYSSTGTAAGVQWGTAGDLPAPGDYDGDAKTDVAVYRPANGVWYIVYSSNGTGAGFQWGTAGDVPISVIGVRPNIPPVADAGADAEIGIGESIALDGTASRDPDRYPGGPLTFRWNVVGPCTLHDPTSPTPRLTGDNGGACNVALIVNDGFLDSTPDNVAITVNPTRLVPDVPKNDTINPAGDRDLFKFVINVPTRVVLQVVSTVIDPCVLLRDSAGTPVPGGTACRPNGFRGTAAVDFRLQQPGMYFVEVSDNGNDNTGAYWLLYFPIVSSIAGSLTGDVPVADVIDPTVDRDLFTFTIPATTRVVLQMTSTAIDPCLVLRDVAGAPVTGGTVCRPNAFRGTAVVDLAVLAGTYFVDVSDSGTDNTGAYSLLYLPITAALASPLTADVPVADVISPTVDRDLFRFTIAATTRVVVQLTSTAIDPCVVLRDVAGAPVTGGTVCRPNAFRGTALVDLAVLAGTYFVDVSDSGTDNTGEYSLLYLPITAASAGPLTADVTVADVISPTVDSPVGRFDYHFTLNGTAQAFAGTTLPSAGDRHPGIVGEQPTIELRDGVMILMRTPEDRVAASVRYAKWASSGIRSAGSHCRSGGCSHALCATATSCG